jgi:hypothetical protein
VRLRIGARNALLANIPGTLMPRPKPRRHNPKVTIKEHDLQVMAEELCIRMGIRFVRVPDLIYKTVFGSPTTPPHVKAMIAEFIRGLPDLLLLAKAEKDNRCRLIEIKTEAGKLSQGQKNWHDGLDVVVCHGWPETKAAIISFQGAAPEGSKRITVLQQLR